MKRLIGLLLLFLAIQGAWAQTNKVTYHFVVKESIAKPVTLTVKQQAYSFYDSFVLLMDTPNDTNDQAKKSTQQESEKARQEKARQAAVARENYIAARQGQSHGTVQGSHPVVNTVNSGLAGVHITDINGNTVIVPAPIERNGEYWVFLSQTTGPPNFLKGEGYVEKNAIYEPNKPLFWDKRVLPDYLGWWIDASAGYGMLYGGGYGLNFDAYLGDKSFMIGLLVGVGKDARITEGSKRTAYYGLSLGFPSLLGWDMQLGGERRHYPEYNNAEWGIGLSTHLQFHLYGPFALRGGVGYTLYGHGEDPLVYFEWDLGIVVQIRCGEI